MNNIEIIKQVIYTEQAEKMIDNLKLLLEELRKNPDMVVSRGNQENICFSLETAIEILEKLKNKGDK